VPCRSGSFRADSILSIRDYELTVFAVQPSYDRRAKTSDDRTENYETKDSDCDEIFVHVIRLAN
jgi:hypothetical protein